MKKQIFSFSIALLGAGLLLTSCSKEEGSGKLSYKLKSTDVKAALPTVSGGLVTVDAGSGANLTWESGTITISEIDFEAKKDSSEIELESKSVVSVDLFNLSPVLGNTQLPEGDYKEVELKVELKPNAATPPLALKGTFTDESGEKTPVEFYFNGELEIEAEAKDLVIDGTRDYTALINFQLNKLLTNLSAADLSGATHHNGVIVISSAYNVDLYHQMSENLKVCAGTEIED